MELRRGQLYKIVPTNLDNHDYFKAKYGKNPIIMLEDQDVNLWKGGWKANMHIMACALFGMRLWLAGVTSADNVYYGKVNGMGELVHKSELKELTKRELDAYLKKYGLTEHDIKVQEVI